MPDHQDSLGGKTLDGDQADRAEQSLGDGSTVGAGEASSLSDLSVGDVAEIANELPLIDLESRYLMGKEIGKGGMGVVTLARDKALNRQVAIKRILGSHVDSAATAVDATKRHVENVAGGHTSCWTKCTDTNVQCRQQTLKTLNFPANVAN